MNVSTIMLIILTILALSISYLKDGERTKKSLWSAKGRFTETMGQVIGILALIGLMLAIVPESYIKSILGNENIILSTVFGAIIGTITIIPAFIAFPLSASLAKGGAHLIAIAAFITTLTMVGFVTMPVEIKHFGKKFTFTRNSFSFLLAIFIAIGIGVIL